MHSKLYDAKKENRVKLACRTIEGFEDFHLKFLRDATVSGKAKSTCQNYIGYLAKLALYYHAVPIHLTADQVNDYLFALTQQKIKPSLTAFKFTVYALRFAHRIYGIDEQQIMLPSFRKEKRLPVVLSKTEMRRLLEIPKLQKHRVLLGLLYGCGLRCFEVRNLQVADFDFDRQMLHVRQGKGKKDRYVPLGFRLIKLLTDYLAVKQPKLWLFDGNDFDRRYSSRGVQWVVQQCAKMAMIHKAVSVHTLRHTFATHLLEDGLDIVSIKELLGHSRIETTLVYLHVAQYDRVRVFSPLDRLYESETPQRNFICPYFENQRQR